MSTNGEELRPWSPEVELLARLARLNSTAADMERARAIADASPNWDRVLALAGFHGVAALVDSTLSRFPIPAAPAAFLRQLREVRLSHAGADLLKHHDWLDLCRAFEAHGIRAVTFKGFQIAHTLYGGVGKRPVGDLDFLVGSRDVEATLRLLESEGCGISHAWRQSVHNVGLEYVLESTREITLVSRKGVAIDLHWEVGPAEWTLPTKEILANAVTLRVEGTDVLVPSPEHAVIILLLHGHRSAWGRIRWLVDIAEALDRLTAPEYDRIVRRLQQLGMRSALASALQHIESLWGRLPTPSVGRDDHIIAAPASVIRYQRRVIERGHDWAKVDDLWRPLRLLRDRVGRETSILAAISSGLRPNKFDWAYVALAEPIRFGYYLVRPFRLLREAVKIGLARSAAAQAVEVARPVRPTFPPARPPAPAPATPAPVTPAPKRSAITDHPPVPFTFVTAIYSNGIDSLEGGRGWNLSYYLPSLINIANLGAPIVVYCAPKDVTSIEEAIAPHFRAFRVIPFHLAQFEHSAQFLEWKREYKPTLVINDRNEMLCFLKSYWVQRTIADCPFGHELYFWIDAGLTHHGLFPERFGGVELRKGRPESHYFPENAANLFTPLLGASIANAVTKGQVFFCAHPYSSAAPRRRLYEQVAAAKFSRSPDQISIDHHLVGGLFGGHRDDLTALHHLYVELLKEFIDTRTYTLEEQVFSAVRALRPELFSLQHFDVWRFCIPGEPTSLPTATRGRSFYHIFTDLAAAGRRP